VHFQFFLSKSCGKCLENHPEVRVAVLQNSRDKCRSHAVEIRHGSEAQSEAELFGRQMFNQLTNNTQLAIR
jgi:hypothetical protein